MFKSATFRRGPKWHSGHGGRITSLAVSPLGDFAATGSRPRGRADGEIRIWNLSTGELAKIIHTDFNSILSLAISPDGRFLAAGGGGIVLSGQWQYANGVEVWDFHDHRRLGKLAKDLFFVHSVSFSDDSQLLLSTNIQPPPQFHSPAVPCVQLWRSSSWRNVGSFLEGEVGVISASFLPDARSIVLACYYRADEVLEIKKTKADSVAGLWDKLQKMRLKAQGPAASPRAKPMIRVWDIQGGKEVAPFDIYDRIIPAITLSPDARLLASCGNRLLIWDFSTRQVVQECENGRNTWSNCVTFAPQGALLASGSGFQSEAFGPYQDCGVKLWRVQTGELLDFLPHDTSVHTVGFTPDGRKLIAGEDSGELAIWQL